MEVMVSGLKYTFSTNFKGDIYFVDENDWWYKYKYTSVRGGGVFWWVLLLFFPLSFDGKGVLWQFCQFITLLQFTVFHYDYNLATEYEAVFRVVQYIYNYRHTFFTHWKQMHSCVSVLYNKTFLSIVQYLDKTQLVDGFWWWDPWIGSQPNLLWVCRSHESISTHSLSFVFILWSCFLIYIFIKIVYFHLKYYELFLYGISGNNLITASKMFHITAPLFHSQCPLSFHNG